MSVSKDIPDKDLQSGAGMMINFMMPGQLTSNIMS